MFVKRLRVLVAALLMATPALGYGDTADSGRGITNVESAEQATDLAVKYSGLDRFEGLRLLSPSEMSEQITVRGSSIPSLADSVDGRPGWLVTFANLSLEQGEILSASGDNSFDLSFIIDKQSGSLIEIMSRKHALESIPQIVVSRYERFETEAQWHKMCDETYHGFPNILPQIPMIEALYSAKHCGLGADIATIRYVLHTNTCSQGDTLNAVWAISCLYADEQDASARGQKSNYRVTRAVVDATTGKVLLDYSFRPAE